MRLVCALTICMITPTKAYHSGAFFQEIGEDFATLEKHTKIINADVLDAWFDPSPRVTAKIAAFLPWLLKTSPPTHTTGLIQTIAHYRGLQTQNILVNGGSSDIMFSLFSQLVKKGDIVLILDPMYGEYAHIFEQVVEAKLIRFELNAKNSFQVSVDDLIHAINRNNPKVVVIVNPNSPTGQYISRLDMLRILDTISPEIQIVIDETYIDYINSAFSLEKDAVIRPNVAIIKSMSKMYALSGARVGYLVAHPDLIGHISRYTPPWSASLVAQVTAVEALHDSEYYSAK